MSYCVDRCGACRVGTSLANYYFIIIIYHHDDYYYYFITRRAGGRRVVSHKTARRRNRVARTSRRRVRRRRRASDRHARDDEFHATTKWGLAVMAGGDRMGCTLFPRRSATSKPIINVTLNAENLKDKSVQTSQRLDFLPRLTKY